MNESNPKKIGLYDEPKMNSLPGYYSRDIIKVLSKNPKELFIFWGISQESFTTIKNFFNVELDEVRYKLYIRYSDESKHLLFREIYLPPFTTSYILKLDAPVKNLRVEIIAYSSVGSTYSLMHSAHINMPINKPSQYVHHEWIHPRWIQGGGFLEKVDDNFIIKTINPEFTTASSSEEEKFLPIWESVILFDGSSGFSSHSIPSSIRKKKENV